MAHMIDNSLGFDAFAFRGEKGWHGLGQPILPTDTPEEIQAKAGADFELKLSPITFERKFIGTDGTEQSVIETAENRFAVYRGDTGACLNVVTERYKPLQPRRIYQAMKRWCDEGGYEIETAGVLSGGGRYWVTANTKSVLMLPGQDKICQYLTCATSSDGTMPTEAFTGETRVVCNNTLQSARHSNVLNVRTRHSTEVNFDEIAIKLQVVSEIWKEFSERARMMAELKVKKSQQVDLVIAAYQNLKTGAEIEEHKKKMMEKDNQKVEEFMRRWQFNFSAAPGADLASAKGMLWGIVNAVTYDIDHNGGGRTEEARFISSQWGKGNEIKSRIWELCKAAANNELDFAKAA